MIGSGEPLGKSLTNPCFIPKTTPNGQNFSYSQVEKEAQVQVSGGQALFPLWPQTRLYEGLRYLSHLFP